MLKGFSSESYDYFGYIFLTAKFSRLNAFAEVVLQSVPHTIQVSFYARLFTLYYIGLFRNISCKLIVRNDENANFTASHAD